VPPISFGPESAEHAATLKPANAIAINFIVAMTRPTPDLDGPLRPASAASSTEDDWGETQSAHPPGSASSARKPPIGAVPSVSTPP
jgi:hypothetical protein